MPLRWLPGAAEAAIAVDDTYFPVLVATFFGSTTEPLVRSYFAWLDQMLGRAKDARVPLVNVTDSGPAGVPTATARRLIADMTKTWGDKADGAKVTVTSYVIVESAAIRGVLRVLDWLHGDMKATHVPTGPDAIQAALADLARAAVSAPEGLSPAKWRRVQRPAGK